MMSKSTQSLALRRKMERKNKLKENLDKVLKDIDTYKTVLDVTLIAVSKYCKFEDIQLLYELGQRDFGENRLESLEEKARLAQQAGLDEIRWHFIGHIQSNKIKKLCAVPNLVAVHSLYLDKHLMQFHLWTSLSNLIPLVKMKKMEY